MVSMQLCNATFYHWIRVLGNVHCSISHFHTLHAFTYTLSLSSFFFHSFTFTLSLSHFHFHSFTLIFHTFIYPPPPQRMVCCWKPDGEKLMETVAVSQLFLQLLLLHQLQPLCLLQLQLQLCWIIFHHHWLWTYTEGDGGLLSALDAGVWWL